MFFYSGQIRTLVAMATYIFNRPIIRKMDIDNLFCINGGTSIRILIFQIENFATFFFFFFSF